ncbi:26820_t:CDS:2, partial [Dentiscutata erythropus]
WKESIGINRAIKRGKRPRVNSTAQVEANSIVEDKGLTRNSDAVESHLKKQQKRRMKVSKEEVVTLNGVKRHRSSKDSLVDNEVASSSHPSKRRKENEEGAELLKY